VRADERSPMFKTGEIISGKYRFERVLGAGAMGMVLQATDLGLRRRVAIKFMIAGGRAGREHEERFVREAQIAGRLRSEHTARVLDLGTIDGGAPYIVMEYLKGKDLAATLRERGPLPIEEAVTYILQASEALAEAHAAGIVHRDIKPANLFLTRGADGAPCIKVVDFGVAKHTRGAVDLTATAQVLGSPLYMPPECMNGSKNADQRVDIWALGVTLFEMLAGEPPFNATEMIVLITKVCCKEPASLEKLRPDLPSALIGVVLRCLAKEPADRWPTVAALASALAPFASARSASYPERIAGAQHAERMTEPMPPPEPEPSDPEPSAVEVAPPSVRAVYPGGTVVGGAPLASATSLYGTRLATATEAASADRDAVVPAPPGGVATVAASARESFQSDMRLTQAPKVGLALVGAVFVALLVVIALLVFPLARPRPAPDLVAIQTAAQPQEKPPPPPVVSPEASAPLTSASASPSAPVAAPTSAAAAPVPRAKPAVAPSPRLPGGSAAWEGSRH
jgi:serine/threonine protein kinase